MKNSTPIIRSLMCAVLASATCVLLAGCTAGHGGSTGFRGDEPRRLTGGTLTPVTAPATGRPAESPRSAGPGPAAAAPRASGSCLDYMPAAGPDKNVTMMAHPTGNPQTSSVYVHQVMPRQIRANQNFAHEIHVTNLTSTELFNVMVMDASTSNLSLVESNPKPTTSREGGRMWAIGTLGPCETRVITLTSRAPSVGEAGNCVVVSYDNNLCALTTVVDPRLEIVKTAPAEVLLCDNIPLQFTVKNAGTGTLENVVINDPLPNGLTTLEGASTVNLQVGTLAEGESKTLNAVAKAARTGRYENSATAAAGDISATSNTTSTLVKQPSLTLTCEPEGSEFLGRTLSIRYTVRNTGDTACDNVVLTAAVPASTTFASASANGSAAGNQVSWNLGTIPAGGTATATLDVTANAIGTVQSSATVNCNCAEPATANCTSEIRGVPAVLLEVVDLVDPVELGTETTYVITVTNQGSAEDTNITMQVELPPNFEFVSASGATQPTRTGQTTVFAPYARLAPGAQIEWRVVARAKTEGNIRSRFIMTTQETSRQGPIEESESTTLYD